MNLLKKIDLLSGVLHGKKSGVVSETVLSAPIPARVTLHLYEQEGGRWSDYHYRGKLHDLDDAMHIAKKRQAAKQAFIFTVENIGQKASKKDLLATQPPWLRQVFLEG